MSPLAEFIRPVPRYAQASNLERDRGIEAVLDYHIFEPGLDVVRRLVRDGPTRAIVITGPYGSGKSTFALYLDALLGPRQDDISNQARARLAEVDPGLGAALDRYLSGADRRGRGLLRATATGRPEPLADTVLRALVSGVERYRGLPPRLRGRLLSATLGETVPSDVADLYRAVQQHAPIALIVDELGVVLDAAHDPVAGGLWLLQDVAEAVSGPSATGFVLGLQHRSLAEQIGGEQEMPTDWRKIQGRFEEVPFVESRDALLSMVPKVLGRMPNARLDGAISRWASACCATARELGLDSHIPSADSVTAACYPLHPSVLLVLPDLTSAYGQRERTLLAFLAGREPHSLGEFLDEHDAATEPLPVVDLPRVYDFFVGSGNHRLGPPGHVSRWAEVERRIREAGELDELEARVVRAIALLNLVGRGGPARASSAVLEFAIPGAPDAIARLRDRGLITYRSTSDEYRIWEGSDLNLDTALAEAIAAADREPLAVLLSAIAPLPPIVAAAHSERTGVLRTFERRYLAASQSIGPVRDGLMLYAVDDTPLPQVPSASPPVIVLLGSDLERLRPVAVEAAALGRLLVDDRLRADWVALRETRERHALAIDRLHGALDVSFAADTARPTLLLDGRATPLAPELLSRLASAASDLAYPATPRVRSEMFALHELTSQGARARSLLFAAMIDRIDAPDLGLSGWGPERAMYASILLEGRLHHAGLPHYSAPTHSPYHEVWATLRSAMLAATRDAISVADVLAAVEARPYGLRRSLTPVLWLAVMLADSDQLALFERGTFVPRVTSDLLERLVKAPDGFSVRHVAARGARADFVRALDARLGLTEKPRPSVVGVVSGLVVALRRLSPYSLRTGALSDEAQKFRTAVMTAREPDRLLFEALPAALGVGPIEPHGEVPSDLVDHVSAVLAELSGAVHSLHRRVRGHIADAFDLVAGDSFRADLRARSQPLLAHVAERRLRGFLTAATEPSLPDDDWLEALVVASGMPSLAHWDDDTERSFEASIRELGRTHRRLAVLYAEAWAQDLTDGFVARRVTVTGSDGRETSGLVWIDAGDAKRISPLIDGLVREVEDLAGPAAVRMVVALLTERLDSLEERDDAVADDRPA